MWLFKTEADRRYMPAVQRRGLNYLITITGHLPKWYVFCRHKRRNDSWNTGADIELDINKFSLYSQQKMCYHSNV